MRGVLSRGKYIMKKLALYMVILALTALIAIPLANAKPADWVFPRFQNRLVYESCVGDNDCDGVLNASDNCPDVKNPDQMDVDDDGMGDLCDDDDGDGVIDIDDNCPARENPGQEDLDDDGIGDVCDDSDWDGYKDYEDNCPFLYNLRQTDQDDDGYGDYCDNCRLVFNYEQEDSDGDGIGDACEMDWDGDGIIDDQDNCMLKPNTDQADMDLDGIGDACDPICDGPNCPVITEASVSEEEVSNFDSGCSLVATVGTGANVFSSVALLVAAALSIMAIRKKVR